MTRYLALICFFVILSAGAYAQTDAPEDTAAALAPQAQEENPYKKVIKAKAEFLRGKLTEEETNNLKMIRKGFGNIRSVQLVRKEVLEAVELCTQEQPDIADDITTAFDDWQGKVQPALDRNKSRLESSISEGFFTEPEHVREYLKLIDKAAFYETQQIKTYPIATKDSCRKLIQSMDRTKLQLVQLLGKIEWPTPRVVFSRPDAGYTPPGDDATSGTGDQE